MHRSIIAVAFAALAATMVATTPTHADVQVGVHIGIPAPPVYTFQAPPRLVVVPGTHVHYAPDVAVNFFRYGGRYYTYDDGNWFVARHDRGPWGYVEQRYVPAPLLRVPNRYYHVPPRLVGGGHWNDRHRYDRDDDDRDDRRDRKHWKKHGGKNGKGHDKHRRKHHRDDD